MSDRPLDRGAKKRRKAKKKPAAIPAHIDRLYMACANYVRKAGGSVLVIGGVTVQEWPGDGPHRFTVGIKCTGTKPPFADKDKP